MKKISKNKILVAVILAMTLMLATACGGQPSSSESKSDAQQSQSESRQESSESEQEPEEKSEPEEEMGEEYPVSPEMKAMAEELEPIPVYTVDTTWDNFTYNKVPEELEGKVEPGAAMKRSHIDIANMPEELYDMPSHILWISVAAKDGSDTPVYMQILTGGKYSSIILNYPAENKLSDFELKLRITGTEGKGSYEGSSVKALPDSLDESRIVTSGDVYEGQLFNADGRVLLCRKKSTFTSAGGGDTKTSHFTMTISLFMTDLLEIGKDELDREGRGPLPLDESKVSYRQARSDLEQPGWSKNLELQISDPVDGYVMGMDGYTYRYDYHFKFIWPDAEFDYTSEKDNKELLWLKYDALTWLKNTDFVYEQADGSQLVFRQLISEADAAYALESAEITNGPRE